ncbi:MAG: 1-acyl-sn-glycerol-3-phosphate acyltransferase [Salaquimonas sp.]
MIFWTPVFFIVPLEDAWKIAKMWAYSHLWLQHKICGNTYEFRGVEKIDFDANQLIGSKHQSAWETYTMILFFKDPGYILKRELMYIPLFGWFMSKVKVVPVDRGKGALALASMAKNTKLQMAERNRQIIIYPEGTRTIAGAAVRYKFGITYLYDDLKVPVQPVALNSGVFWGRRASLIYPGKIIMEFLDQIQPGLSKDAFSKKLYDSVETASNRLMLETANSDQPTPLALELKDQMIAALKPA